MLSGAGLSRAAFCCNLVLKVVRGCIPFLSWPENAVKGELKVEENTRKTTGTNWAEVN